MSYKLLLGGLLLFSPLICRAVFTIVDTWRFPRVRLPKLPKLQSPIVLREAESVCAHIVDNNGRCVACGERFTQVKHFPVWQVQTVGNGRQKAVKINGLYQSAFAFASDPYEPMRKQYNSKPKQQTPHKGKQQSRKKQQNRPKGNPPKRIPPPARIHRSK